MSQKMHFIYIVVILIFAGTTIWWVDHSYKHDHAAEHYIQHIKDYPLLDPALPFYEKENLIVNIQELREYLKTIPEQNKDWAEMSIYFEVLNTGANISINKDLKIWPASLIKLPIAMVAMKKVQDGEWALDKKFTMLKEDADLITTPGIESDIGKEFELNFLLERLLLKSDNTAYQMIARNLTNDEIISIGEAVGLDDLFYDDEKISAKDYTRLLRTLHLSAYLDEQYSSKLLTLMADSEFKDFIRSGIPSDIIFAHKWGTNLPDNVFADSGIVYVKNRPYIISVMIHGIKDNSELSQVKANAVMKEIGERTYKYMKEY